VKNGVGRFCSLYAVEHLFNHVSYIGSGDSRKVIPYGCGRLDTGWKRLRPRSIPFRAISTGRSLHQYGCFWHILVQESRADSIGISESIMNLVVIILVKVWLTYLYCSEHYGCHQRFIFSCLYRVFQGRVELLNRETVCAQGQVSILLTMFCENGLGSKGHCGG